jgi:hypothetical protein
MGPAVVGDMCSYQAFGRLPVAGAHACVLAPPNVTGPTGVVGTGAEAICASILAPRACHCSGRFGRCAKEQSGADEGDREEQVPGHL